MRRRFKRTADRAKPLATCAPSRETEPCSIVCSCNKPPIAPPGARCRSGGQIVSGAGGAFNELGKVEVRGASGQTVRARMPVAELAPGVLHEWYAVVNDCTHDSKSAVQRFRTTP